jgi:hypothetical protein
MKVQLRSITPDQLSPDNVEIEPTFKLVDWNEKLHISIDGEYIIEVALSKQLLRGDEFFDRLRTQPWDCLIMCGNTLYKAFILMLVEQHEDKVERIGIIEAPYAFVKKSPKTRRKVRLG